MAIDYASMQVGDRVKMPTEKYWDGVGRGIYDEAQEYCASHPDWVKPQFEIETVRHPGNLVEFWLKRIR